MENLPCVDAFPMLMLADFHWLCDVLVYFQCLAEVDSIDTSPLPDKVFFFDQQLAYQLPNPAKVNGHSWIMVTFAKFTLPETNSSHLKMDGWKTTFLWKPYFQVLC